VKNLKKKAIDSLCEKIKKYLDHAKKLPFFVSLVKKLKKKAIKSLK
jgi:hypothetical protein